jgi:general secretion pathway protein K
LTKEGGPYGQNGEVGAYNEAGFDYAPRQGPFQNVLELPLVLGLPQYIVERILPLVTVYSGHPEIDIRVAPPEVLSALLNVTPDRLKRSSQDACRARTTAMRC